MLGGYLKDEETYLIIEMRMFSDLLTNYFLFNIDSDCLINEYSANKRF
jgi:hypothetical protein